MHADVSHLFPSTCMGKSHKPKLATTSCSQQGLPSYRPQSPPQFPGLPTRAESAKNRLPCTNSRENNIHSAVVLELIPKPREFAFSVLKKGRIRGVGIGSNPSYAVDKPDQPFWGCQGGFLVKVFTTFVPRHRSDATVGAMTRLIGVLGHVLVFSGIALG